LGRVYSQTVVEHHTAGRVYRHFVCLYVNRRKGNEACNFNRLTETEGLRKEATSSHVHCNSGNIPRKWCQGNTLSLQTTNRKLRKAISNCGNSMTLNEL